MQQVLKSSKEAIQHPKESFPTVQPHPEAKLQKPTTISAAGVNESLEFSASQVGGHLQYFTSIWRQITTSHWVLQTKKGHKLEFLEPPPDSPPHLESSRQSRLGDSSFGTPEQRSNRESTQQVRVFQPNVCSIKERWGFKTIL